MLMKYCGKKRIQKFLSLSIELFLKILSIYKEKPPYLWWGGKATYCRFLHGLVSLTFVVH